MRRTGDKRTRPYFVLLILNSDVMMMNLERSNSCNENGKICFYRLFDRIYFPMLDIFSTADQTGITILRSHNYLKIIYISFIECERCLKKRSDGNCERDKDSVPVKNL